MKHTSKITTTNPYHYKNLLHSLRHPKHFPLEYVNMCYFKIAAVPKVTDIAESE
jgi:hypothetical protein